MYPFSMRQVDRQTLGLPLSWEKTWFEEPRSGYRVLMARITSSFWCHSVCVVRMMIFRMIPL